MKYLALIYGDEATWEERSEEERKDVYERYSAFSSAANGKLVGGAETAGSSSATTVRVRDGQTQVTDGTPEALDEALGGFFVFECESLDEAVELASRIPGAETGAVEVRPAYVEEEAS